MPVPQGVAFEHPSASSGKPHYLSYATARSVADDGVWEVWNGPTNAARVLRVNKDGQIQAANGTVLLPAWSFESDKDSGVYRIGANNIGVAVAGAKVLDVGVGGLTVVGTITGTLATAAQTSVTSLGTLTALTVNGATIVSTVNGIDINPGSDIDTDLITVGVTGAPKLSWVEASDAFEFNNDVLFTGVYASGNLSSSSGTIRSIGVSGFDVEPGSDIDADLITVVVTGTPRVTWDESEDSFLFTKGFYNATGTKVGFYGTLPIAQQTGVAVTAGGIHAALVALGVFTA